MISVSEDKALQILPRTTSVCIEEVVKNIQEIHTEAELAVTDTKEKLRMRSYSRKACSEVPNLVIGYKFF